jgi:hypothetical protein
MLCPETNLAARRLGVTIHPADSDPAKPRPTLEHDLSDHDSSKTSLRPPRAAWIWTVVALALIAALWVVSWSITHSPGDELIR